jgi:ABC-2 type transport system ATP-binding protein
VESILSSHLPCYGLRMGGFAGWGWLKKLIESFLRDLALQWSDRRGMAQSALLFTLAGEYWEDGACSVAAGDGRRVPRAFFKNRSNWCKGPVAPRSLSACAKQLRLQQERQPKEAAMNDTAPIMEVLPKGQALAISARRLVRHFGDVKAVDGIDLDVPRGMIFAILGPNGAGKTTLIRMLATLLTPDAGSATVMGHDLVAEQHAVRASIAMTGQFASLDEDLTARENLILLARLWGFRGGAAKARADELLAAFDLADAAKRQVKNYSGGMRRRLDIAASLIVTPGVLFLDEPTTGLDPKARQGVWRMIRQLTQTGVTILLTTQYLEEADQLAARIAVIDHGRKIAEGTSRELKAEIGSGFLHVTPVDPASIEAAAALLEARLGSTVQRSAEGTQLSVMAGSAREANEALAALISAGIEISDFFMGSPSLDEVFFALTGAPAEDHEQKEAAQ